MTELLTAGQVADLLGITEDMVKRRTKSESWTHVRFSGKTIRYRAEHVEAIIAAHEKVADVEIEGVSKFDQTSRSKAKSA